MYYATHLFLIEVRHFRFAISSSIVGESERFSVTRRFYASILSARSYCLVAFLRVLNFPFGRLRVVKVSFSANP